MARTTWILGAGFSRPLGGPLLGHMLTPASQMQVRAAFPKQDAAYAPFYSDSMGLVYALYERFGPRAEPSQRHWEDAEAFLEALDIAASGATPNATAGVLEILVRRIRISGAVPPLPAIAQAARRVLAAECSAFLKDADPRSEKWAPYKTWARSLMPGDTVISFNYDLVVETARDAAGGVIQEVVPPVHAAEPDDVPLLKLHGSVDWRRVETGLEKADRKDFALTCPQDDLVIASPGPTKQHVTAAALESIWREALIRIEHAQVIVFVGYRFPPTDSQARRKLITAISANQGVNRLTIRTVLGPDTTSNDALRLKGILEYAMAAARRKPFGQEGPDDKKTYHLKVHPLGAEDFLDLFAAGQLDQVNF